MANRFPLIFNSGAGQIQELAASDNLDLTSSNLVNAGILFTSSGSATAPSLQIGSGTTYNPGLYSPGTDQVAVATNGTQKLIILSDGKTGIGASSPIFLTDILSGTPNTGANVNNPSQLSVTGPNKSLTTGGATVFVNSNSDFAIDTGGSIALCGRNTTSSTNSVVWGVVKGAKENATSTNTAGYLAFASQNHNTGALVEAMRIDSSGRLLVGTVTGNANGGVLQLSSGITFPATAVAASDPNTLDDYEEGTFTATLVASTSGTITVHSSINSLAYTKIGRVVYVQGLLEVSSVASPIGTMVLLQGLPFTTASLTEYAGRSGGAFVVATSVRGISIFETQTQIEILMDASTVAGNTQFYVNFNYIAA